MEKSATPAFAMSRRYAVDMPAVRALRDAMRYVASAPALRVHMLRVATVPHIRRRPSMLIRFSFSYYVIAPHY